MSRNTHYRRERLVLLLGCLVTALTAPFYTPAHSQSRTLGKVVIKVTLNDNEKMANLVQNFGLVIKKLNNDSPESAISAIRVKTTADGSVSLSLIPGDYVVESEKPLMSLTCDGKPVTPIQRGKIEFVKSLSSYLKTMPRTAYAGVYTYSAETFAPDKCKQMSLQVVSQQSPTTPEIKVVDRRMVQQVWSDFEPYRH